MSHPREDVMLPLHAACTACYKQQLELLETAQLVSASTTDANLQLLLHYTTIEQLEPFPTISDDEMNKLENLQAAMSAAEDEAAMRATRLDIIAWMAAIDSKDFSQDTLEALPRTDNGLNKRMRDELFQMKRKIRETRRRLHDESQEYDKEAFVQTRNQLFLSQGVYLEQLRLDLVRCTHAEVAEVEQILMPAIEAATGATFVSSLSNLRDFILARILPADPADPTVS